MPVEQAVLKVFFIKMNITIKLLGVFFVVVSTTLMGIKKSKSFSDRVAYLENMQLCINQLKNEINYTQTPLVNAIEKAISSSGNQPVLLCASPIRLPFRRLIERTYPQIAVMSYNEISNNVKSQIITVNFYLNNIFSNFSNF